VRRLHRLPLQQEEQRDQRENHDNCDDEVFLLQSPVFVEMMCPAAGSRPATKILRRRVPIATSSVEQRRVFTPAAQTARWS
jgi:hypothetical protein